MAQDYFLSAREVQVREQEDGITRKGIIAFAHVYGDQTSFHPTNRMNFQKNK